MPTPFLRRYFPTQTGEETAERLLDNEYQLERICAGNADDAPFVEYLQTVQGEHANLALKHLQAAPGTSVAALLAALSAPEPTGTRAFTPANVVAQELAAQLARLRDRGAQIEQVLTNPAFAGGESQLLIEAARALKNGMTSTGRDQQEEFKDSLQLFREAQAGAIGNRNYVVWFQIGWILWKSGAPLADAEEAFYQAYRLSAATQDIFYRSSQRHRAYLQFLQNKPADARDTITRAVSLYPDDPDVLCDAARYCAASGAMDDATRYLGELLRLEPGQAVTLFADAVFAHALPTLAPGVWQIFEQGTRDAAGAVEQLIHAEAHVRDASERSGVPIALTETQIAGVRDARELIRRHGATLSYSRARSIVQTATVQTNALYDHARTVLQTAASETEQQLVRPRRQIERLLSDQKKWKEDVAKLERAARQSKINIAVPPKRGLFGRFNPEHASLYENYQTARGQAEINAGRIADEMPVFEAEIKHAEAEQAKIADTIAWLAGCQAGAV